MAQAQVGPEPSVLGFSTRLTAFWLRSCVWVPQPGGTSAAHGHMWESGSPEARASCLHTTTEAHGFYFHHPQRGRVTTPPIFSACNATGDLPLYFSFPSFSSFLTSVSNRWPNWGGLKPLQIKFQAGWLPWESGWMWWQATWCPPSTAASWEKVDFPEGPCDLPADAGGPALADCVTWAQ